MFPCTESGSSSAHQPSRDTVTTMSGMQHVVVVGSSLAGLRACETLRSDGFAGAITLVGAEDELPYDRPPLSKKFLAGEWEADRIRLRKADEFAALALELRLGVAAVQLRVDAHEVVLADDRVVSYDAIVITTGTQTRRLASQPDWPGVVELRTLSDAADMRDRLQPRTRLVVIGAGFIGLEVAATAAQRGAHVTVLEGAPAPLMRALGETMGHAVASVHGRHGVEVRSAVGVAGFEGDDAGVRGVYLTDGEMVPADVVLVGVGVRPATDWLADSGLLLEDGVVCDASLRAASDVYAAGDCVRWPNAVFDGEVMRIEHWTNAAEQGAAAARSLLAVAYGTEPEPYESVPFFWSDQFDSRVQFVGRAHGDDDVHVFAGDVDGAFAALYGWNGRLRGVLGVSKPRLVMPFRTLIAAKASWDEALAKAVELTG
jgi:NADPH-dependent 2,4-dienoyl-CoA reductase/sulfur reductase-like enzyme